MKKILFVLFMLNTTSMLFSFLCCVTEQEQVDDVKEQLNQVQEITIDPFVCKTKILSRYKHRNEENITWYAQLHSPAPACISLSSESRLAGLDDPSNHLIWYEWIIQVKNSGVAEIRLEQYKNAQLQKMQFVRVHVKESN